MRICIDPGHGGIDSGAVGNGYYEKNLVLNISLELKKILEGKGLDIVLTRDSDITLENNDRIMAVKESNAEICISIHLNASNGAGRGCETIYQHSQDVSKSLAELILSEISDIGIRRRRAYFRLSNVNPSNDYYFMLRQTRPIPTVIVECLFIDNKEDMDFIMEDEGVSKIAQAIASGVDKFLYNLPSQKTLIMGTSKAYADQMEEYVHRVNQDAPFLATLYLQEGNAEDVRGDLAFAQAILETSFFRFGGGVSSTQNNFAGLGSTGSGVKGTSFKTPQIGIRAHVQHLKAYASKEMLNNPLVDPRFSLVARASAPNIEDLNGKWAVPGARYGEKIVDILNDILETPTDKWWEKYFYNLSKLMIVEDFHHYGDNPSWGEFAAVLYKTLKSFNKIGIIKGYTNSLRNMLQRTFAKDNQKHWSKLYFETLYSIGLLENVHMSNDKVLWGELATGIVKTLNYTLYNDFNKNITVNSQDEWAKPYFDNLTKLGIIDSPHNSYDMVKWGELAALVSKTINYIKNI